jgi:uncharacterized protein with PIN domain
MNTPDSEQNDLKFLVDRTAGKLARWLRILGFDVEYVATCEPAAITKLARRSGRRVITRNRDLTERIGPDSILLGSEHLNEQLKQVVAEVGSARCHPFTRCSVCNAELANIDKDGIEGRIPQYVFMNHDEFAVCPVCGRYYWQGTHWDNMVAEIERMMEEEPHGNRERSD